jgi:predicted Rossmann fold nucleotide-binding protein DprA/Smf involved in DNA uptake
MTEAQGKALRALLITCSGKLHHGDAVGADAEAHDIAVVLGRRVVIHPASLPERRAFKSASHLRSPKAPFTRNKIIVRETSVLIAAPGDRVEQLRSGTWATIRYARKLKRPIAIIYPDGIEEVEIAAAD